LGNDSSEHSEGEDVIGVSQVEFESLDGALVAVVVVFDFDDADGSVVTDGDDSNNGEDDIEDAIEYSTVDNEDELLSYTFCDKTDIDEDKDVGVGICVDDGGFFEEDAVNRLRLFTLSLSRKYSSAWSA
jgi:hypothetical protein